MPAIQWHKKTKDVEEQQELKRRAVLDVAASLFSSVGYKKTSLDDIAAELDLTKPALYYYARNKENILMQCALVSLERVGLCFDAAQGSTGDGLDRVHVFFRSYAALVVSDFGSSLMREARRNLTGKNQEKLRQTLRDGQDFLEEVIEAGIKDKSIRECSPKRLAQILFSAFNQMPEWYDPDGPEPPEVIGDQILNLMTNGIKA
ncbi:TetR/AcrR family transcriptional regulator [Maritimibacter alexandrii]|uniref:TetR/AcrR family transcriptional regulator n=1 Tax=Maritimibacter alexandrii TaxID=2570355 RepID=UPI0014868C55|nr:TetR/AcrR family transcriptional regulator [Maritimibacter alexandrii]MBY5974588.1 TetR/AcrR family transcriptional regulator [Ferrimonas balearica]